MGWGTQRLPGKRTGHKQQWAGYVRLVYGLLKHLNFIDSCGLVGRDMVCGFLALF